MDWEIYPRGLYDLLKWVNKEYSSPKIYITENGAAFNDILEGSSVHDDNRIEFLSSYIEAVNDAVKEGVDVAGYFVWSLMDNFEWAFGNSKRFGLIHVDYDTLKRTVKSSGKWYASVCKNGGFKIK